MNPPVVRASTVVFDSVSQQQAFRAERAGKRLFTYGARGNPTGYALEDMICELEGGYRARLYPTGLAAIAMVFLSYLKPGDHVLIADCVYEPVRRFARVQLTRLGIRYTFFSPSDSHLASKIEPSTRMIYAESPGSLVYDMLDLRGLSALARRHGLLLVADNTWGSGLQCQPLELGADVSIIAATKYLSGHSDVMMGAVTTTEEAWMPLNAASDDYGMTTSADDAYLVLRGIRSLAARLAAHEAGALKVADWLTGRPEVAAVFCPALSTHAGHALWRRDCAGTNGLVSFELRTRDPRDAERWVDALTLFGLGSSWGGYESLVSIADMAQARSLDDWSRRGPVVRLHIGLEAPEDLLTDLENAFETLAGHIPGDP